MRSRWWGLLSALLAVGAAASGAAFRGRPLRSRPHPPQGLWVGPERFRLEAKDWISLNPDGWAVHTCPPGHPFISWELAVRYEAACQEARYRYLKLCDVPTDAEAADHIERIAELLLAAERLSRIELGVRPALDTDDADTIRFLAEHPHAAPQQHQIPRESLLRPLADKHLTEILPRLQQALTMQQQRAAFHPDVFELLVEADRQIPGPGTHTAIWDEGRGYRYPFDEDYEAVLRPLRYVPADLRDGYVSPLRSRYLVTTAGGHLEGCIRTALRDNGTRRGLLKKPLGTLIAHGHVNNLLDPSQIAGLEAFTRIAVNPAKHEFTNARGPESLFNYEDALYAYFLARHFGAAILQAANSMPRLQAAVDNATKAGPYFWGAPLSIDAEAPAQGLGSTADGERPLQRTSP